MKKAYLLLSVLPHLFFSTSFLIAQDTLPLSLGEALAKGSIHDHVLQSQQLRVRQATLEAERLNARRAPVVQASTDLRSNLLLPTTIIPGDVFSSPGQEGEDVRIRFGTIFNINTALDARYPLLDPLLANDLKIAHVQRGIESSTLDTRRQELRLQITEAWYGVFIQQEQMRMADEKVARARELWAITQARASAGSVLPADVLRSELDLSNALSALELAQTQWDASRQTLSYLIGLPLDQPFRLVGAPLPDIPASPLQQTEANRPELQVLRQRVELAALQHLQTAQAYKPKLDVYASAAVQHLSNNFSIWQNWFPFSYIGLQAKVVLFDGHLRQRNEELARVQQELAQQELEKQAEAIAYEMASADQAIRQATLQWSKSQANLAASKQLYALERTRYAEGKIPYSELINTEYTVREAERNVLNTWYNYLIAKAKMEKATGG